MKAMEVEMEFCNDIDTIVLTAFSTITIVLDGYMILAYATSVCAYETGMT